MNFARSLKYFKITKFSTCWLLTNCDRLAAEFNRVTVLFIYDTQPSHSQVCHDGYSNWHPFTSCRDQAYNVTWNLNHAQF